MSRRKRPRGSSPANPFNVHQLRVARGSLRMPQAMLGVMGGPSKAEARKIIRRLSK